MKRILTSILMAAGIAGPFVARVAAQDRLMEAEIPFSFVASNTTMPAGHYRLSQSDASRPAFLLHNTAGGSIFVVLTAREEGKPNKPSLTFACHGNQCVLARIAPPASLTAYSSGQNAIEKNLRHTIGMASMVSIKLAAR